MTPKKKSRPTNKKQYTQVFEASCFDYGLVKVRALS
jgi:hypothetical protein